MSTAFSDNLGTSATAVTITLNSLASSATVGRQATPVTLVDGNNNVPYGVDIDVALTLGSGTLANDKAVYVFAARSVDGTNYEAGPPATGASDAAFTFANSPVGASPLPTDLYLLGAITFNASGESRRKMFRLFAPMAAATLVVLNYTGIALASSGNSVQYRRRYGDGR